jgi:hypothetical protein
VVTDFRIYDAPLLTGSSVDEEEVKYINPSLSAECVGTDGETIMDGSDQTELLSSSDVNDNGMTGYCCITVRSMVS